MKQLRGGTTEVVGWTEPPARSPQDARALSLWREANSQGGRRCQKCGKPAKSYWPSCESCWLQETGLRYRKKRLYPR